MKVQPEGILKYIFLTFIMAAIVTPIFLTVSIILFFTFSIAGLLCIALLILCWYKYIQKVKVPSSLGVQLFPIVLAFAYYMILFMVAFWLSDYSMVQSLNHPLGIGSLLMIGPLLVAALFQPIYYPYILIGCYGILLILIAGLIKMNKKIMELDLSFVFLIAGIFALGFVYMFQQNIYSQLYIKSDREVETIRDEIDYGAYSPFFPKNQVVQFQEEPTLVFESDWPRLDGATAAFPVYSAMTELMYRGLNENTVYDYVQCNTTLEGYQRLISDEADIFFGAQPSVQQTELAQENGVELVMTPIAKEAFVFFVHQDNPVANLTLAQVQDIYTKKITNWKEVGGNDEPILAFQRPENSGSQTIMLAKVMNGIKMATPLKEEFAGTMGGIINEVAAYRNYSASIGYSFRFYATGMNHNENIRFIAVEGIEPTIENISDGTYPFTVNVYAVTKKEVSDNSQKLIDWILSEQGQRLIEQCGYVPINR